MAGNRKRVIIGGSVVLLVAIVAAIGFVVNHNNGSSSSSDVTSSAAGDNLQSSTKSVQAICHATDYRDICISSISKVANGTTDPRELVKAAFQVASDHIREALAHSQVLSKAASDPRTKDALHTCGELMNYAIEDILTTFNKLGVFNMTDPAKFVGELKLWLDAAATYQETCLDGFQNTTGDASEGMRKALNASMELTDNALAIVGELEQFIDELKLPAVMSRRLLSEEEEEEEQGEFPSWVSAERRRLLAVPPSGIEPDVVVAQDGSGDFSTINEALAVAPIKSQKNFVVYVKTGVNMTNIIIVGDGATKSKVTGSLNFIDGTGTFKTASFGK
ncbi:hypothetical protein HPP92_013262 [Vanilla planifolia]|uniref:Pectinesterase inhibitor domain-containing protein n=1 Tax=Vanilla planifolia TaxID=51239 RepID=A0A835QVA5_VANPL|nr:hypothetical protein HPP92_013262 [Vanilla planifolia]